MSISTISVSVYLDSKLGVGDGESLKGGDIDSLVVDAEASTDIILLPENTIYTYIEH